jgi:hypothetical protein
LNQVEEDIHHLRKILVVQPIILESQAHPKHIQNSSQKVMRSMTETCLQHIFVVMDPWVCESLRSILEESPRKRDYVAVVQVINCARRNTPPSLGTANLTRPRGGKDSRDGQKAGLGDWE